MINVKSEKPADWTKVEGLIPPQTHDWVFRLECLRETFDRVGQMNFAVDDRSAFVDSEREDSLREFLRFRSFLLNWIVSVS